MFFSPCISSLFSGKQVYECLRLIRDAGYERYEFWSWWDQDIDKIAAMQDELGLKLAAMCTRFIPLNDSVRLGEYHNGLEESLQVAQKLGCPVLITQVGQLIEYENRTLQQKSIINGLRFCEPLLEKYGTTLVIEPLNTKVDHQGYYLENASEAFHIVNAVGSRNVKVLYDIYHQYITEQSPLNEITDNIQNIGHFHLAGYPGRHEPWLDSDIDYRSILRAITNAGYTGGVGLEYYPIESTIEGLRYFRALNID